MFFFGVCVTETAVVVRFFFSLAVWPCLSCWYPAAAPTRRFFLSLHLYGSDQIQVLFVRVCDYSISILRWIACVQYPYILYHSASLPSIIFI
jgi:hypothetical protein